MPASSNRSLFLQVGADVSPMRTNLKAGQTALLALAGTAGDVQQEVQKQLAAISADPSTLRQLEASYKATFDNIRRNAQSALAVNDNASALKLIDATGAQEAAAAARAQAAELRIAADAAATVAKREGDAGLAARTLAAALEVQAIDAAKVSAALSTQAGVMTEVAAEAKLLGAREDEVSQAHGRMGASGMIAEHVVRAMSDSIAAGQSPVRALTMEMGRITEAVTMFAQQSNATEGAMGKLADFMGGPWGLAVSVALAVLTPLVAKLFEGNGALDDAVSKLKEDASQTALADAAHRAFAKTIEGEIDAQKRLNDELDKQVRTERQTQQFKLREQQQGLADQQGSRSGLVRQIVEQQRNVDSYSHQLRHPSAGADPNEIAGTAIAAGKAQQKLDEMKRQLSALDQSIAGAERGIREAEVPLIDGRVQASLDGKTAALLRYTVALGRLRDQFAIGPGQSRTVQAMQDDGSFKSITMRGIGAAEYQRRLTQIEAEKQAAEKATKDADRTHSLGSQLETERAGSLLSSAQSYSGLSERTSSGRSALEGLFQQAGMHVDPQMTAWCAAFVNAVLATNGIKGTGNMSARSFLNYGTATEKPDKGDIVVLKRGTGAQGHVGFYAGTASNGRVMVTGGNQGDKVSTESFARSDVLGFRRAPTAAQAEKSSETAAHREQTQAEKTANEDRAYRSASRQADDALARAKMQLTGSIEDEYKLSLAQIANDLELKNDGLQDQVAAGKMTQARAYELMIKNAQLAEAEEQLAADKYRVTLANAAYQDDKDSRAARVALLQIDAELADTRKQRVDDERKILDEEQAQRRSDLAHTVATTKEGSPERARAQAEIGQLPEREAGEKKQFDNSHLDALAAYKKQIHDNAGDMNTALKSVEVDGLKGLEDGLVGVLSGTESVASAFKKMASSIVSDLIRIAAEKAILSVLGFSEGGAVDSVVPIKKATGGAITGKGTATSDSILSWLSNGEFVVNAAATSKHLPLLKAINDNSLPGFAEGGYIGSIPEVPTSYPSLPKSSQLERGSQRVAVEGHWHITASPEFDVKMQGVAVQTVGAAAEPIMAGAQARTMRQLRRTALPGGTGW